MTACSDILSLLLDSGAESAASAVSAVREGLSTGEIAVIAAVMFAGIAVFGVMFLKIVQKDRHDIRGIHRK